MPPNPTARSIKLKHLFSYVYTICCTLWGTTTESFPSGQGLETFCLMDQTSTSSFFSSMINLLSLLESYSGELP
ncbi:hypothetical protein L249_5806 [Ophiocordyceps polyrhachis-furcata BCC 54312]|uniref:Uncharacterized protein n=1 Tax=Ophiocordyceps polyrhachis-furcata BCC 54312 TaxID=1330021 RepID=A0A367L086_9HYPO|nr:hypothetical protein L249_5806 [Ophiocordyceps polyrhachis-furcata BCC 54312]